MSRRRGSSPGSSGFSLALTLFLMAILATVFFGAVSYVTLDARAADLDYQGVNAYYAARAGLMDAISQLKTNYSVTAVGSSSRPKTLDERAAYYVTIERHGWLWKVESTGLYASSQRSVEAWVGSESFARYVYFTEREKTADGVTIWFITQDAITGPCHTNGYFSMYGNPRFSTETSSANEDDPYFDEASFTYRQGGVQTDPFRFYHYYPSGRGYATHYPVALNGSPDFTFAGGQSRVDLPTEAGTVQANANKSYSGDRKLVLRDDGTARVYQWGRYRSGRRWREGWLLQETIRTDGAEGLTVYVDGTLEVEGTLKGRVTVGASEDVRVTNDLEYADTSRDVMGIVAEQDVVVVSDPYRRQDRTIHASMMALNGSFTVADYNRGTDRGTLHVYGGIIQRTRGPVGTFGGRSRTGYVKDYVFDEKLLANPPVNFPTTGDMEIRSLIDRGSLGSS